MQRPLDQRMKKINTLDNLLYFGLGMKISERDIRLRVTEFLENKLDTTMGTCLDNMDFNLYQTLNEKVT